MKKINLIMLFMMSLLSLGFSIESEEHTPVDDYDQSHYLKQVHSPILDFEYGKDENGITLYYKIQEPHEKYLYFGPNEVFFNPAGEMKAKGIKISDEKTDFNKGREFHYVTNFVVEDGQMEWEFFNHKERDFDITSFFTFKKEAFGSTLSFQLDNHEPIKVILDENTPKTPSGFQFIKTKFEGVEAGLHKFVIKFIDVKSPKIMFYNARFESEDMSDLSITRNRWRPKAVFNRWESSKVDEVKSWVMEFYSDTPMKHFSPTTTFNYFGPIFESHGLVNKVNFVLWSFGKNDSQPPVEKLSHLLGIGSSKGIFSDFKHEGTGVKIREWAPFEGTNTSKKYVIALRHAFEDNFDTYYGYFWNEQENRWQFYTAGRKYALKPKKKLHPTGFIEVFGVPNRQRSGNSVRTLYSRGWIENAEGEWHEVDTSYNNPDGDSSGLHNGFWGVSDDGQYFFTQSGGLRYRKITDFSRTITKAPNPVLPAYMGSRKLGALKKLPFIPSISGVERVSSEVVKVSVKARTLKEAQITLCWGQENAQTNEKYWDHCDDFKKVEGNRNFSTELPADVNDKYFRVLVRDGTAQMWNMKTYSTQ